MVELQWVRNLIAPKLWSKQRIIRIENLKYQQFIRPHDEVSVELKYDEGKNKLSFKSTTESIRVHQDGLCLRPSEYTY